MLFRSKKVANDAAKEVDMARRETEVAEALALSSAPATSLEQAKAAEETGEKVVA